MAKHNELGKKGEDIAANYLKKKGYKILEKNWRFKHKEIDLIGSSPDGTIVFVEVKLRSTNYFGNPEDSIGKRKEQLLLTAAEKYLQPFPEEAEARFDVISIVRENDNTTINHIEGALGV